MRQIVYNDKVQEQVKKILNDSWWLPALDSGTMYRRLQDDAPPSEGETLNVCFGEDGDAWVKTFHKPMSSLRFRIPMIGGGSSHRTRMALMILAYAIKLDNEDSPQR